MPPAALVLLASAALIAAFVLEPYSTQTTFLSHAAQVYDFKTIAPSKDLRWTPCYDGFQCAKLDVPLDWSDSPITQQRANIAIVRLPAKVNVADVRYGGAVLFNPGGPGGSGVSMIVGRGKHFQTILDSGEAPLSDDAVPSSNKYFDVISWDPRGVNHTTPAVHCFSDVVQRSRWYNDAAAEGMLGSSDMAFEQAWARHKILSKSCTEGGDGSPAVSEFVNTPSVVQDMVEIIERLGEWREKEAKNIIASVATSASQAAEVMERAAWRKGREKLQYWGFSYGTVLGATFAAMEPERVSKVILDGVVDTDDYYNGTWLRNLQDTDRIVDRFAEYCYEAGARNCSMYSHAGVKDIRQRFDTIIASVKKEPLGVSASKTRGPALIKYSDLKQLIRGVMYAPYARARLLSDVMHGIESGNGTLYADKVMVFNDPPHLTAECREKGPFSNECNPAPEGGFAADVSSSISCSDAQDQRHLSKEEFVDYWHTLQSQSATMGDGWAEIRMSCVFWNVTARNKFNGQIGGKTAFPILFIGNTYDPVTPLRNAFVMSNKFEGSSVLHQESEGHCSAAGPSMCSAKIIRAYFQTGALPKKGTMCAQDESPFARTQEIAQRKQSGSEDELLLEALRGIVRSTPTW